MKLTLLLALALFDANEALVAHAPVARMPVIAANPQMAMGKGPSFGGFNLRHFRAQASWFRQGSGRQGRGADGGDGGSGTGDAQMPATTTTRPTL